MDQKHVSASEFGQLAVNNFMGEAFRLFREVGVTQVELADLLGVSQPTISRWANGSVPLPAGALLMMCGILQRRNCDISAKLGYLIEGCAGKVLMLEMYD